MCILIGVTMESKATDAPNPAGPSKAENPGQAGQLQAASHRAFTRSDEDGPVPRFTNDIEFSTAGMDIFMDVGTVSPESIRDAWKAKSESKNPTVKFNVDFRFAMSLNTAFLMLQRLTELVQVASLQLTSQPPSAPVEERATPKVE